MAARADALHDPQRAPARRTTPLPQLAEQIHYNLLFRWFVGLGMDDAVWDLIVFSINRDRLLNTNVAHQSTTTPRARLYKKGEFAEAKLHH